MANRRIVSAQTRNNFFIDSFLFTGGVITALSGVYFLFLPAAGYQGGRNPMYGIVILFTRHTWGDIHIWAGVAIIALAAIHIPLHWKWIVSMTGRAVKVALGKGKMNNSGKFNLGVNMLIGLSALISGLSGLYFLLIPGASHASVLTDPMWLFSRTTWDLIHTWSGIIVIAAATLHSYIHWKWAFKVTRKYWRALVGQTSKIRPENTLSYNQAVKRDAVPEA
ncbi:MAG: DUF4405 domain-containing protein [Chloroflexi bacterium]|nr:DUF4405 domain-containing protein [Chloroflexota bacterium]MBU1660474.1 DUF4405 domain-containing protein [Chloroflexota bacterium]